ncbi:hypothetical protein [Phenylobacterium deserti]|uniref:Uncharacterized protein n=1 Tax=Phenylobacterium deserti TaxID=1914756 RepID=A0A328AGN4_9CAUL|nr:hypothetical protein [Phenylobacterium deserti]RAK51998.1 hypothetical protein DJ018_12595 [Phenylobacterium deserti]
MRNAIILSVLLATTAAAPASAKPKLPPHSWGKPGISFLQYRTDTVECVYAASVSKVRVPMADIMILADDVDVRQYVDQAQIGRSAQAIRVAEQVAEALDACLAARGYRPFRLTDEQRATLRTYRAGMPARQQYLFRLAADPDVLIRQGL